MAYTKTNWNETTPITPTQLNRMETSYDEAVNWAKGFGLGDVAKDIANTDLNNLDLTGFYKGYNLSNEPVDGGYYFVNHVKWGVGEGYQFAVDIGNGNAYIRKRQIGTWGAWQQLETTAGAQAKADQAEQDAKDWAYLLNGDRVLDTRATNEPPSYYYGNANRTHHEFKQASTMGVGLGEYGVLVTLCPWSDTSGGTVKQTFYDTDNNVFFRQSTSATTWGAWQTNATQEWVKGFGLGDSKTIAGDLNTHKTTGFFKGVGFINSPPISAGNPDPINGWFFIVVQKHDYGWVHQTAYEFGTGKVYNRSLNNTTWGPWVGTISTINGKGGTAVTLTTSDINDVAQSMPLNDIVDDLYGGKLNKYGDTMAGDLTFDETKGPILNDLDTTKKYRLVVKSGQLYLQEA